MNILRFSHGLLLCTLSLAMNVSTAQGVPGIANPLDRADGLANNEPPEYPPASRRNGEEGLVEIKVLVDDQGVPLKAEINRSSGFPRLDRSARATAMAWRYQPKRLSAGSEATWFLVPFNFVLEGPSPLPAK